MLPYGQGWDQELGFSMALSPASSPNNHDAALAVDDNGQPLISKLCPSWSGSGADLLPIVDISFPPLDCICSDVRQRIALLPWQSAITADQLSVIQELLQETNEGWVPLLQRSLNGVLEALVGAAAGPGLAGDRDARLALLILAQDFCLENDRITQAHLNVAQLGLERLLPLLKGQQQPDEVIVLLTARLLTIMARLCDGVGLGEEVHAGLLAWILHSIKPAEVSFEREPRLSLATLILLNLLRLPGERERLLHSTMEGELLAALVGLMRSVKNTQILYHVLTCLWMLSFEVGALEALQSRFNLISLLVEVAKQALKEKVVRLCVALWRNYLAKLRGTAVPVMIGAKVLDFLEQLLAGKRLGDEELQADAAWLLEQLTEVYQSLNSFDEYASEVKSGHLDWTPPHRSAMFWQDNAVRLEERDCELLRLLTRLLAESQDTLILSIAASDVGHYAQHRPTGRKHLEALGTKQQLMLLMSHSDPEVRFHALFAVQQYMANLWKAA